MAVCTTDIVAPVIAAAKVVVLLFAGVATSTRLRDFFRRFVFEGDDLLRIAFFNVRLAWSMARLATRHFVFPTSDFYELRVGGVREGFELLFVEIFARLTAHIVAGFGLSCLLGVRRTAATKPDKGCRYEGADRDCFNDFKHRA